MLDPLPVEQRYDEDVLSPGGGCGLEDCRKFEVMATEHGTEPLIDIF